MELYKVRAREQFREEWPHTPDTRPRPRRSCSCPVLSGSRSCSSAGSSSLLSPLKLMLSKINNNKRQLSTHPPPRSSAGLVASPRWTGKPLWWPQQNSGDCGYQETGAAVWKKTTEGAEKGILAQAPTSSCRTGSSSIYSSSRGQHWASPPGWRYPGRNWSWERTPPLRPSQNTPLSSVFPLLLLLIKLIFSGEILGDIDYQYE